MMHKVWFFMELITVKVLDSNTNFSRLFNMESICDKGKIWVDESHDVGHSHLKLISWVEQDLNPSLLSFLSQVVSDWTANFSLAHQSTVESFIQ